jgi:DNA repair protein RadC
VTADTPDIEVGQSLKQDDDPTISSYHDITDVYQDELKDRDQENMVGVFLSASNHVLGDALLFRGGHRSIQIEPREVVRHALLLNASAVILLHNHPGGDPEPTDADITATEEIKEALDMFEMNLLDHVIVSPHGCISMKRDGSLP